MSFSRELFRNIETISREDYLRIWEQRIGKITVVHSTMDDAIRRTADGIFERNKEDQYFIVMDGFPGETVDVRLNRWTKKTFTRSRERGWTRILVQINEPVTSLAIENGYDILPGETELITSPGQID